MNFFGDTTLLSGVASPLTIMNNAN